MRQAFSKTTLSAMLGLLIVAPLVSGQGTLPKLVADTPKSILTPNTVKTERLGTFKYFDGMPDEPTVRKVYENLDFMRGVDAFLTGIPAASAFSILEGFRQAGMSPGDLGIFEGMMDAQSLFLTPNTSMVHCMTELDVKDGPLVMEIPPGVLGPVNDIYFRFVTDLGITGPDQGKGGKYLFVHSTFQGEIPNGYYVVKTTSYRNLAFFRAFVKGNDVAGSVQGVKDKFRMYPLARAANPPEQKFMNLSGKKFNTIHSNDFKFYDDLNAIVQHEPAEVFSPEFVGTLAAIGIKKGQPFKPDLRMKKILIEASAVGNATARALTFAPRKKSAYFYRDRHWYSPFAGGSSDFMNKGELVLDDRIFFHYYATGLTPSMAHAQPGSGLAYLMAVHDSKGRYLDGGKTYAVTIPGPAPVKDFWSFTVYDGQTRSLLETDQKSAGVDSASPPLQKNPDGTYTIWFGPAAPGGKEGNWIQTVPNKSFNAILRLYGPLQPWFSKTWKPGDFELQE